MEDPVQILRALSDATRLRIVRLLSEAKTAVCVCEITDALSISQYNASYHLKELRISGLVQENRDGKWVYYSLTMPHSQFHQFMLRAVLALPYEFFAQQMDNLGKRLATRENGKCIVGISSKGKPMKKRDKKTENRRGEKC